MISVSSVTETVRYFTVDEMEELTMGLKIVNVLLNLQNVLIKPTYD